jgi:hypothetical protein
VIHRFLSVGYFTTLSILRLHREKVFENRILRRIFGPEGDEIMGGCRKLREVEGAS